MSGIYSYGKTNLITKNDIHEALITPVNIMSRALMSTWAISSTYKIDLNCTKLPHALKHGQNITVKHIHVIS